MSAATSAASSCAGTVNRALPSYFVAVSNSPVAWISRGGAAQRMPPFSRSTATSISRPRTTSSTRIRRSKRAASCSAASRSSSRVTRLTPWLDPADTGFTTISPSNSTSPMSSAETRRPRAVPSPTASATSFVVHLSMPMAPARSPEPTTRTPASAHSAARAPSSPRAPCTAGKTTSVRVSSGSASASDSAGDPPFGRPSTRQIPSRSMVTHVTS
ncbi:hypothetical protein D514_0116405 [Microbacterium sp. UCD-TDU]|nr:hypothetical protein D514_0116405 [Microbacterium sp. UCD-TDU]